jgi:hypothetical protein
MLKNQGPFPFLSSTKDVIFISSVILKSSGKMSGTNFYCYDIEQIIYLKKKDK